MLGFRQISLFWGAEGLGSAVVTPWSWKAPVAPVAAPSTIVPAPPPAPVATPALMLMRYH